MAQSTQTQLASLDTQSQTTPRPKIKLHSPNAKEHPEFDKNRNYFNQKFEYSSETLAPGIRVKHDVGVDFYYVCAKDTIWGIIQKLSKLDRYAYLAQPKYRQKMYGFNIKPAKLQKDMLIPIPLESRDREITDEQFVNYCQQAIAEMKTDKNYGEKLQKLLQKFSEKEVLALMLAVAKQESGGRPLGQFVFSRWEDAKHIRAFSFSIFHVVMRGPGFRARKNINCTEGQCYHPQNAAKLFLAFLFEKAGKLSIEHYLPLDKQNSEEYFNRLAKFYNGIYWRDQNPDYVRNIKKYLRQARILLQGAGKIQPVELAQNHPEKPEIKYYPIGKTTIYRKILNWPGMNLDDHTALVLSKKLIGQVKTYHSSDEIAVWRENGKLRAALRRGEKIWTA